MRNLDAIQTSIVLYGQIQYDSHKWWDWYLYSKKLISAIGYEPNYFGAGSATFKYGKILTVKRNEKRLNVTLKNEEFRHLSIFALPDEFVQAVFDYKAYFSMNRENNSHIILSIYKNDYDKINSEEVIHEMKKYINFSHGQIFNMLTRECPGLYATQINNPAVYKSLNVIKEF